MSPLNTANGIKVERPAQLQCAKLVLLLGVSSGQLSFSIHQSVYSPGRYISEGISQQTAKSWEGITQF